jgi:hypothetical protein
MLGLGILALAVLVYLIWKNVYTPSISVAVDKTDYMRNETVNITGVFSGSDPSGKTVTLTVTPPSGTPYIIPDVVTDATGNFSTLWSVATDTVDGIHTLTAATVGVSADTTFKQTQIYETKVWMLTEIFK